MCNSVYCMYVCVRAYLRVCVCLGAGVCVCVFGGGGAVHALECDKNVQSIFFASLLFRFKEYLFVMLLRFSYICDITH